MTVEQHAKPYRERMFSLVADPELKAMEIRYEPYLDIHAIEDVLEGCDIIQASPEDVPTGKLIWKEGYDLPLELKRDIINLYNKHFIDQEAD